MIRIVVLLIAQQSGFVKMKIVKCAQPLPPMEPKPAKGYNRRKRREAGP